MEDRFVALDASGVLLEELDGSGVVDDLAVASVGDDATVVLEGVVLFLGVVSEAPVLGDDDSLTSGELVLGTTKGLNDVGEGGGLAADGEEDLSNVDAGNKTVGLSVGTTHSGLESVVCVSKAVRTRRKKKKQRRR